MQIARIACLAAIGACAQSVTYGDATTEVMPVDPSAYSGQWTYGNGVRRCDGFVTRNPAEAYCASQPPSDWQSFEYEGKTYYMVRLVGR